MQFVSQLKHNDNIYTNTDTQEKKSYEQIPFQLNRFETVSFTSTRFRLVVLQFSSIYFFYVAIYRLKMNPNKFPLTPFNLKCYRLNQAFTCASNICICFSFHSFHIYIFRNENLTKCEQNYWINGFLFDGVEQRLNDVYHYH